MMHETCSAWVDWPLLLGAVWLQWQVFWWLQLQWQVAAAWLQWQVAAAWLQWLLVGW